MKYCKQLIPVIAFVAMLLTQTQRSFALPPDEHPWNSEQLLEPATLAKWLEDPQGKNLIIFNIGPVGDIKGSTAIGPVEDPENLAKLEAALRPLNRSDTVVIYCGCCPFTHCPNVRPAFKLLEKMGFSNGRLLNLSENLKEDWIRKGYPMAADQ